MPTLQTSIQVKTSSESYNSERCASKRASQHAGADLPVFPESSPLFDVDQIEYSIRDIAQVLGEDITERRVRYHAKKLFPRSGERRGWYHFDLREAKRLYKYIQRVRYKERDQQTIAVLTEYLQTISKK